MIARDDIVDILMGEDEALVLTTRQCVRITTLAASIVDYLTEPRAQADLEAHLERLFGPPPQGRFEEILHDLAEQRIVRLTS